MPSTFTKPRVAKLVPFPNAARARLRVDTWKGKIWMSPDFDAPLSEEELKEWADATVPLYDVPTIDARK